MATQSDHSDAQAQLNQVDTPSEAKYLTSWCGGMGCDNCKLCLIFSGRAELIHADDKSHKLIYRIKQEH